VISGGRPRRCGLTETRENQAVNKWGLDDD
jgi:hypothetical protein